ncbi:polysaccharide pyruvyl transferase family protein [Virgibacillus sp. NKC19-16]|uniref:polysaccharide pyruvyl transferase family protein n=1 Tax=Virgibacillus salidurans TaxID=2831673 RepID=UPI001F3C61E9|nr:polysaccharide pyruvyl transferase family protein [Virgibacillus sp. NKC19-16]UJL45808.1 polysaccharide pyruvyl transferase family protein [Virgibacillus sp. NKC19-16]
MRKRVMIYAYTNFNLGDDLFIKILCERYPETNFILYAPNEYKYSLERLENVSVCPSDNFFIRLFNFGMRILKVNFSLRKLIARKSDAIVHIGGSIFIQKGPWNGIPRDKQNFANKPYYVLGANFGPFHDQEYYKDHYELFKQYTDVCFRDSYSYELFKDLSNIRLADDIVFQLNKLQPVKVEKKIIISIIKPSFRKELSGYDEIYYQRIKDIAVYFVEKGYQVTLMSFCEKEGDQEAVEEILQLIPDDTKNNVNKYFYRFNLEEALDVIGSSSFVIATRFHAMILGWVYNKPVFPIAYSKKMNHVMKDLSYKGSYIDLKEINNLRPADVYESMNTNYVNISDQAKDAENHFKKLDEYLLNSNA